MLQQLRNLNVDRIDLDEAIALEAYGGMVRDRYVARQLPIPEWIEDALRLLGKEILSRRSEMLEKRRRELRARLEAEMTASERKAKLRKELDEVETQLTKI